MKLSGLFFVGLVGLANVALAQTTSSLPIKVDGDGYLRFVKDGKIIYAKSAKLTAVGGQLVDVSGAKLAPMVEASSIATISIDLEGNIFSGKEAIGRLVLASFSAQLQNKDSNGFFVSANRPTLSNPGEGTMGVIRTNAQSVSAINHQDASPDNDQSALKPRTKSYASLAEDKPKTKRSKGIEITFGDVAEVDSDTFKLGQVATINCDTETQQKLASITLGDTPPLGIERIVERSRILIRARVAGIDENTISLIGPDMIKVIRKGQKISNQMFADAALRGAQVKGYTVALESAAPVPEMNVPIGDAQLICESITANGSGVIASIGVYVDGKRFNSRTLRLQTSSTVSTLKVGSIVKIKVTSHAVSIESRGKVLTVDPQTGQVTVQVTDTGATLVGTAMPDGSVQVKA